MKSSCRLQISLVKQSVREALSFENVDRPCEVNVLITGDKTIREFNREFRGVDKVTDVLSFPMIDFSPPGWVDPGDGAVDPETGLVPLGEIVISAYRVREQAHEFMHSIERESVYLTVHSALHLLGYDHVDEGDSKRRMRDKEKIIMQKLGF
ncbi:MAG: rRNA maturation RNase YbeY [Oscillospiraceae bacterium]|nr:rRNA maturation RNase YbeY [Oscillospiraceae bacterium]